MIHEIHFRLLRVALWATVVEVSGEVAAKVDGYRRSPQVGERFEPPTMFTVASGARLLLDLGGGSPIELTGPESYVLDWESSTTSRSDEVNSLRVLAAKLPNQALPAPKVEEGALRAVLARALEEHRGQYLSEGFVWWADPHGNCRAVAARWTVEMLVRAHEKTEAPILTQLADDALLREILGL